MIISKSNNAIGARALYSPLSLPRIFLHLAVYSGTVAISTEKYTEGLHLGASGEGGSSLHGPISARRFATSHHLDGFLKVRAFWKAKTQLLNSDFMALR